MNFHLNQHVSVGGLVKPNPAAMLIASIKSENPSHNINNNQNDSESSSEGNTEESDNTQTSDSEGMICIIYLKLFYY